MLKWPAGHFEFLQQAIGESNSFEGPVDRPCPGEQSLSIDGNAVGHLFQVRDDLEVQTASMRVRMLLEAFDQGLRNILDGQSCYGSLLCNGSVMAPLWRLVDAYHRIKPKQMH
jgi:hypothetical protein